jgi:hypothetical protein
VADRLARFFAVGLCFTAFSRFGRAFGGTEPVISESISFCSAFNWVTVFRAAFLFGLLLSSFVLSPNEAVKIGDLALEPRYFAA